MTLLEQIYRRLHDTQLVGCAEDFSMRYLGKNKNWYAYQTHTGREFSVDAAINCLALTRKLLAAPQFGAAQVAFCEVEQLLSDYLLHNHKITEIRNDAIETIIRHPFLPHYSA